jgi:hypothetical protein
LVSSGPPSGVASTPLYLKRSVTGTFAATGSPKSTRTLGPKSETPTWSCTNVT